jgi:hypothetical protein
MELAQTLPNSDAQTDSAAVSQPQVTSNATFVTYENFDRTRMSNTAAEKKQIPGTGEGTDKAAAYYNQVPLLYNYGTKENPRLTDFQFEGCEVTTKRGIQTSKGQSGRDEHSIAVTFNTSDPEQLKLIAAMTEVHAGSAQILQNVRGAVGMPHFQAALAEAANYKNPVYYPRDKMSGELIPGRAPSMFFKLFSRGTAPFVQQTLFTGLDGKPIPWTMLRNVEMTFIPLLHFKKIYVGGGKASLQFEMVSAVVTSIKACGSSTSQEDTIKRVLQKNPELLEKVASQLALLMSSRQDQLLCATEPAPSFVAPEEHHNQPTFAGILTQNNHKVPVPPVQNSPPSQGVIPSIPGLSAVPPSMESFTAEAPVRTLNIPAPSQPFTLNVQPLQLS